MITTRAVSALLPAHYRRVARTRLTIKDFADPLVRVPGEGDTPCDLGIRQEET